MFDPQRTRYSNKRYYTRKGQVIQAKRVDAPLGIESRLVPMYKEYLVKNHLISASDFPPKSYTLNEVYYSGTGDRVLISDMAVTIAPTSVNNCVGIAIGIDPDNQGYYIVYVFYAYNNAWNIPSRFAYKTWTAGTSVDVLFEFGADDTLGLSYPIKGVANTPAISPTYQEVLPHKVSRDIVTFE